MAYSADWSNSIIIDHTKFNQTPAAIRALRLAISERLTNMFYGFTSGETQTDEGVKNLPYVVQVADPGATANKIKLYAKDAASKAELFFQDEDGNVIQLTDAGKIRQQSVDNIPNNTYLKSKNAAGTGTVDLIKANASDVAVVPDGTQTATNAAPSDDKGLANKKFVTDQIAAIPAPTLIGSPTSKSAGTTYQAATDGFLVGNCYDPSPAGCGYIIYSDSAASPTTVVQHCQTLWVSGAPTMRIPICVPIKKNNYYLVRGLDNVGNVNDAKIERLNFIPLGT